MSNTQKDNHFLQNLHKSMQCALDKAKRGSAAEDGYFIEKLRKTATVMGFVLLPDKALRSIRRL